METRLGKGPSFAEAGLWVDLLPMLCSAEVTREDGTCLPCALKMLPAHCDASKAMVEAELKALQATQHLAGILPYVGDWPTVNENHQECRVLATE